MKSFSHLIIFILAIFTSMASAQAPREQLNQMVEQLQKTPTDNALREKIIKLAQMTKPAPAVPEEAQRREGRAKFAFKSAKSNDDYLVAAREYEEAVRVAPWIPGYYLDLCTIYEKAEKYVDAKRNCEISMVGLSDPAQVSEVRQRIAGLEFGLEKTNAQKDQEAKQLRVSGAWRMPHALSDGVPRLEIIYIKQASDGKWNISHDFYIGGMQISKDQPWTARDVSVADGVLQYKYHDGHTSICATYEVKGTVSADGKTLSLPYVLSPFSNDRSFENCPPKSSHRSHVRTYVR